MDWDPIIDGLQVSGIGMGMVALVLVVLAAVVRATSWADEAVQRRAASRDEVASGGSVSEEALPNKDDDAMRAAVIGVALALAESGASRASEVPIASQSSEVSTAGAWLSEGRARQRLGRGSSRNVGVWR